MSSHDLKKKVNKITTICPRMSETLLGRHSFWSLKTLLKYEWSSSQFDLPKF